MMLWGVMDATDFKLEPGAYWFLTSLHEPRDNQLRVVIIEGKSQSDIVSHEVVPGTTIEANPIEPDATCRAYELTWPLYVAFSVRNESYWQQEQGEEIGTGSFGVRENSAYLEYVSKTTFASSDYPGPLTHWFVYALNHCLDVISVEPPEVKLLNLAEAGWDFPPQLMH